MQIKKLSFTALLSLAVLFSCTDAGLETSPDISSGTEDLDENSISIIADVEDDYTNTTKGTAITESIAVTSLGLFANVRTPSDDDSGTIDKETHLFNSYIFRNIYGNLEFETIAYWPILEDNQSVGFIGYSPHSDAGDNVTDNDDETDDELYSIATEDSISGLSNASSTGMRNFSIDYEVPSIVANQPDLFVSDPVDQTSGAVTLKLNHALATVIFNVKGDGVVPVESITVTNVGTKGSLDLNYTLESVLNTETSAYEDVWIPDFNWELDRLAIDSDDDGTNDPVTKEITLSLTDETLVSVLPSDEATPVSSSTGALMMIPQTVLASTEFVIKFTDGNSRSVRFFNDQVWEPGGLYNYNINVTFEGDVVDFTDPETVSKLVNNTSSSSTDLETANCYILNPPLYTKEQEEDRLAEGSSTASTSSVDMVEVEPLVFTRAEGEDNNTASVSETFYGALYYIPITQQMKTYYEEYAGGSIPAHASWYPMPLWYDSPLNPIDKGIILQRVEERNGQECFSVYVPFDYRNYGNLSVGVESDLGAIIWSWHLWITDYNPYNDDTLEYTAQALSGETGAYYVDVEGGQLHHYADNTTTTYKAYYWSHEDYYLNRLMMDRNLGSMNSSGGAYADADAAGEQANAKGLYYQYGRKDPFPNSALHTSIERSYKIYTKAATSRVSIETSINFPFSFYCGTAGYGTSNTQNQYNWCDVAEYTYVWNDERYTNTEAGEYYKSLFDPSPIGFMVPTINVWNDFILNYASSNITLASDANGISYKSSDSGLEVYYPITQAYRGDTGTVVSNSGCWTSTPSKYIASGSYMCNHSKYITFSNTVITLNSADDTRVDTGSKTMGYPVRSIQRWYGDTTPVTAKPEE